MPATPIDTRCIIFRKLGKEELDIKAIFEHSDETINIVFNLEGHIIAAHSQAASKLFGVHVDKLVGLNLEGLHKYTGSRAVITMIRSILTKVKESGQFVGCFMTIGNDGEYTLFGFPITDRLKDGNVVSVLLNKSQAQISILASSILE